VNSKKVELADSLRAYIWIFRIFRVAFQEGFPTNNDLAVLKLGDIRVGAVMLGESIADISYDSIWIVTHASYSI
jgi:hypothetical protein